MLFYIHDYKMRLYHFKRSNKTISSVLLLKNLRQLMKEAKLFKANFSRYSRYLFTPFYNSIFSFLFNIVHDPDFAGFFDQKSTLLSASLWFLGFERHLALEILKPEMFDVYSHEKSHHIRDLCMFCMLFLCFVFLRICFFSLLFHQPSYIHSLFISTTLAKAKERVKQTIRTSSKNLTIIFCSAPCSENSLFFSFKF